MPYTFRTSCAKCRQVFAPAPGATGRDVTFCDNCRPPAPIPRGPYGNDAKAAAILAGMIPEDDPFAVGIGVMDDDEDEDDY